MAAKGERKGGTHVKIEPTQTGIDPRVEQWQKDAATNLAALSAKQRKDRQRVRVKYDLDPALKATIEATAKAEGTSASQVAAFLLAWGMKEYRAGNAELRSALDAGRSNARTPRVANNLDAPHGWIQPGF